eukprot:8771973-Pyramimonas_sp.AAC.1
MLPGLRLARSVWTYGASYQISAGELNSQVTRRPSKVLTVNSTQPARGGPQRRRRRRRLPLSAQVRLRLVPAP